jgi:hypothetical protein
MPRRLAPDVMLSSTLDAICSLTMGTCMWETVGGTQAADAPVAVLGN